MTGLMSGSTPESMSGSMSGSDEQPNNDHSGEDSHVEDSLGEDHGYVTAANFGYVVVEGPIGVGKTSLCNRLAQSLGLSALLERPDQNPFLERFYREPDRYSLATQLHFLFQRIDDLGELTGQLERGAACVSDFLLDKDPLFAQMNLDPDEYELYMEVYRRSALKAPTPDLVIYLQAPVHVLEERISRRGVVFEQAMSRQYLERINDMYVRHFLHYTDAPLLTINAESINFVDSDEDFASLLRHASKIRNGRHYFNPLPSDALKR